MSTVLVGRCLTLPVAERGDALLELEEDQWFDRKSFRVTPQALANVEVGFANADGGTVVIGLHGGQVEGTDSDPSRRNALMQASVDFTDPPVRARPRLVECINSRGDRDHLLVVEVETGEIVHSNHRDEAFLRVGDENRKLSFRQRQELIFDKGQAVFEATPSQGTSPEDLDRDLVDSYAQALGHPDSLRLLKARGLLTENYTLTAAGLLLFGAVPQATFPEAHVRVLRYLGTERGSGARQQLTSDARFDGPIPKVLLTAAEEIRLRQPSRRALARVGRFERTGLVPEDAWLEGLVNAVVHRSYSLAGDHIRVDIFDDRIEIESPGRFPGLAYAGDPLKATRFARNPRIARVCSDLNFGQELGEGIRRMFEEMRLAGLADPLYRQTSGSVRLTLSALVVDRELEASLPPGARALLDVLRRAGQLGTGDIVDAVALSRPAVLQRLKALESAGLIEWVGKSSKDPRAFWRLRVE